MQKRENFVKNVPDSLMGVFNVVCSGFNELNKENITLVYRRINTTMRARPSKVFGKRKYLIIINNDTTFQGIMFHDIPEEARIGIVAHEMSHILDYSTKTNFEILKTGLNYMSGSGQKKYEKAIDLLTIQKGFGRELKAWAQFSMFDSEASESYKLFKRKNYLTPNEIDELLNQ